VFVCVVDGGAMTDSAITDSCPPADSNHVPTQHSHDDTPEFDGDSHCTGTAAVDVNPTVTATKIDGGTEHVDGDNGFVGNCEAKDFDVSRGKAGKSGMVEDHTKLPLSSDLRTNGCDGRNLGNSSSAAALLLTNGHVDM